MWRTPVNFGLWSVFGSGLVLKLILMLYFWHIILGLVQGVTEFFPVSSSGHLVLVPYLFNFSDPGLGFSIALHAGTLVAILFVFRHDWISMFFGVIEKDLQKNKLLILLAITSVPGALVGYFFEEKAATIFRNPLLVSVNLVVFGLILFFVDKRMSHKKDLKNLTPQSALLVGISQALAILPGVSRSGATVTAGRLLSFKKEEAFRYSFLAAAPITFGATVFGLRNVSLVELFSPSWILGFFAALVSSIWAMKFLLNYVKTHDFKLFLWWRIVLAVIIILLINLRSA